jgi:hypothetical protein
MKAQPAKLTALFLSAAILIPLLAFGACGKSTDEANAKTTTPSSAESKPTVRESKSTRPVSETTSEETKETAEEEQDKSPDYIFPVEGLRPYAIMIDNAGTGCLPQGGIEAAQIVYEAIVEYGISRFMLIYWDTTPENRPEMIGPVRSSRHYFLDFAMEHDAIYIHFGGSPMAKSDIQKFKINNADGVGYGGEIYFDITDNPGNWQDSYTTVERIEAFVKRAGYRTKTDEKHILGYTQNDVEPSQGQEAKSINLKYSSYYKCSYVYDEEKNSYKRFRDGKEHIDRNSGNQLEAKNIIIQYVKNYRIPGDKEDRQELETVGSGNGYFISCGKAIKIKWSKDSRSAPTSYTDENGNEIKLNPGQTWIQIMPLYGEVTIN